MQTTEGSAMTRGKQTYEKPRFSRRGNLRDITFHHSSWTCSIGIGDDDDDHGHGGRDD
ncbi:MAG: hypothetical protein ACYCW5_01140 [Thermoleophilia bacterium]